MFADPWLLQSRLVVDMAVIQPYHFLLGTGGCISYVTCQAVVEKRIMIFANGQYVIPPANCK